MYTYKAKVRYDGGTPHVTYVGADSERAARMQLESEGFEVLGIWRHTEVIE